MVSMQSSSSSLLWRRHPWGTAMVTAALLAIWPTVAQAQQSQPPDSAETEPTLVAQLKPLQPDVSQSGLFSVDAGNRLMAEAQQAIDAQNYDLAADKLKDTRRVMNQSSNFYQALTSSFLGVDNVASNNHRQKALETAQIRDRATAQLATVYRAQNKPDQAIPLLIEIIRSQRPDRELGKNSYQQLLELGFVDPTSPDSDQSGLFSIPAGKRLMAEAETAVQGQDYTLAARKLKDTRRVMNQLSNFYQALTSSFLGVDGEASDKLRRNALETAQIRDQATYQLSLVYRAQNKPEQAIPLLVEIIRSQRPDRELGTKSYQQLLELGFVDTPFPRRSNASAPTTVGFNP